MSRLICFQQVQNVDIELPDALRLVLEKDFFAVTNDRQVCISGLPFSQVSR